MSLPLPNMYQQFLHTRANNITDTKIYPKKIRLQVMVIRHPVFLKLGPRNMAAISDKYIVVISKKYVAVISDTYVAVISDKYMAVISDGRRPKIENSDIHVLSLLFSNESVCNR